MISALSGTISEIMHQEILLECSPFSCTVFVPNAAIYHIGKIVHLKTYLHWNQEQGFSLFGFQNNAEKLFFLALLGCSGIGPRLALSILAHASISVLCGAIKLGDTGMFTDISGIGQKKAEQIILHMKHALKTLEPKLMLQEGNEADQNTAILRDLESTLLALQYTRSEIYDAFQQLYKNQNKQDQETFDAALRKTLTYLSTRR